MRTKMVKSFLIALFCILIPFSSYASEPMAGNLQGDLHITVFITDSLEFMKEWIKSEPTPAPTIRTINEAKYNQKVHAGFAITGFTKGPDSKVNFVVAVQVLAPDGSILLQGEKWAVYTNEVTIEKGIIIPDPFLEMEFEPTDPAGNYKISATVTDKISDKKATSSVILKIKSDDVLALQKEDYLPDTAVKSDEGEKGLDMVAGGGTPPRELDQSAEPPGQVAAQASAVDEVAVKDKAQTEAISKIQLVEAEKRKSKAAAPVEKEAAAEPQVILPQNIETTKAVEYGSIAVGANIRSDASLTSEVVRTVPAGYPVAVLERQAEWLLVEDYRGRKGWVFASLVTEPGTVIIKVFKGNLRSGPSLKDEVIVQLDHGTLMSVIERRGEWLKVSDLEELTGWLHLGVIWPAAEMNAR